MIYDNLLFYAFAVIFFFLLLVLFVRSFFLCFFRFGFEFVLFFLFLVLYFFVQLHVSFVIRFRMVLDTRHRQGLHVKIVSTIFRSFKSHTKMKYFKMVLYVVCLPVCVYFFIQHFPLHMILNDRFPTLKMVQDSYLIYWIVYLFRFASNNIYRLMCITPT